MDPTLMQGMPQGMPQGQPAMDLTGAQMDPAMKDALVRALMGGGVPMDAAGMAGAQSMQAIGQPDPYAGMNIPHIPATQ